VRGRALFLGLAALAACDAPPRTARDFADDPEAARRVTEACAAGRRRPDCKPARVGLAEARRRERMAAYESAF
jgi:hypothetical protein